MRIAILIVGTPTQLSVATFWLAIAITLWITSLLLHSVGNLAASNYIEIALIIEQERPAIIPFVLVQSL